MISEKILVVETKTLFPNETYSGFMQGNFDYYTHKIIDHSKFLDRSFAETDPTHKQIIPYLVFMHEGNVFMMQRAASAGEQRLKNKLTLGIGGHIREEDFNLAPSMLAWAQREFHEEVDYKGTLTVKPLGIINDNSNSVGEVHAGFVYLLEGSTSHIKIKSELKSGKLVSLAECKSRYEEFERWSQFVIDQLTTP